MGAMRAAGIFIAVGLISVLLLGAPAHAVVPHDHGGHTHAEESPQWNALHGALRHEDKKDLLFLALIALGMLFLASRPLQPVFLLEPLRLARVLVPEEVRRGIVAYRRFG